MRIVDPKQIANAKVRREKRARRSTRIRGLALSLAVVAGLTGLVLLNNRPKQAVAPADNSSSKVSIAESNKQIIDQFTPEQFLSLYNSFSYPNTQQIDQPPEITGNVEADTRIRTLAEARGYKLRSLALDGLVPVNTNFSIQPMALQPWLDLQALAAKDGLDITTAAAYRSIKDQQSLFLEKMSEQGITADDVANGYSDETINIILQRTAIPGYSRHHTGFTLDLICDGVDLYIFDESACFQWLSNDNYAHAKQFGWVPSYPKGASLQGPEPEPWEYIWVGVDALYATD